ncbi:MarR family winged helix-turn-helix transcriptional regulator [Streptomyces sp. NPDC054796]
MEFSHDDAGLARQPIGYWSWAAHKAVVTHIRTRLAEVDMTQPRWWVLGQLHGTEDGRTRQEVTDVLQGYLDVGGALQPEIDTVIARGLATQDEEERLRLTPLGEKTYAACAERVGGALARVHDGIPEEEYVRTLKVLQRMIHNVGGTAWHQ